MQGVEYKSARAPMRWLLFATYATAITILSLITLPGRAGPALPGLDKVVHALFYAVYVGLLLFAIAAGTRAGGRAIGLSAIAACLHGAALEVLQPLLNPGHRSAEGLDLAANIIGALGAAGVAAVRQRPPPDAGSIA